MVDVITEIAIEKPIAEVAGFVAEPDNAPIWYDNIKSAVWKTPKPLATGSQITFKAAFMGKTMEYTYEVTEYIHGKKMVMQTAEGPFPMKTTYLWESKAESSTLMTLRNTGQPTGLSALFKPVMSAMMKKANRKDLKKLKQILEGNS